MKLRALCFSLLIPFVFAGQNAYAEASAAVQQMAGILLQLDNLPTKQQREQLEGLAKNSALTANEQNLAKALVNFNGTVRAEDKQLVWGVLRSISAAEGERELAKIINGFNTKASKDEQQRLEKLLPPKPKAAEKENKKADKGADKTK